MTEQKKADEGAILQALISSLSQVPEEVRVRLLKTVAMFFDLTVTPARRIDDDAGPTASAVSAPRMKTTFSNHPTLTPKEFILEKQPRSDIERVTCLAFYLTHYRDSPQFRTTDITKLNTEAAHPNFSNTSVAMKNAVAAGYLAPATRKLHRQLSALGEQYVQMLPDREGARQISRRMRPRRTKRSRTRRTKKGAQGAK